MITVSVLYWMSFIAFLLYGIDKRLAVAGRRRIPEALLLTLAIFGGAFGALMAMLLFRHKTRKTLFLILVPLLFIGQWIGAWFLCSYLEY